MIDGRPSAARSGSASSPSPKSCAAARVRTLDIFLTRLLADTGGRLPENFVVTLAKVTIPRRSPRSPGLLARLEEALDLPPESLKLEIMVETPQAILNARGECNVLPLVEAGRGRCVAAHFGTYDYTGRVATSRRRTST